MDGFALLGMETWPDASAEDVEQVLADLLRKRERALIYLQSDLAQASIGLLQQVRSEGGDILVSEIPDILSANDYRAPVEILIERVLGHNALGSVDTNAQSALPPQIGPDKALGDHSDGL
jgi:vacuolar-type H+-ATPase subunit F/Vma7